MKRQVDIYIEGVANSGNYSKIELFNDEEINVSSSIQNIQDISKIFTDFSQSFTVPASVVNNQIFEHFYNNDVDNTLDHNLRRNAFIEIDLTPFRTGRIQLEKSNIKNNVVESYSITFYGEALSLKDRFGETKLKDLDYSLIDTAYSGTEVQSRITDTTDYEVRYPLISSERLWSYGDATSTDISTTTGKIDYTELFPAVKIDSIFNAIENYFNIDFAGQFQANTRWTNCFLYCKNKETFQVWSNNTLINLTSNYPVTYGPNYVGIVTASDYFDLTNNKLVYTYDSSTVYGQQSHTVDISINVITGSNVDFVIEIYDQSVLLTTYELLDTNTGDSFNTLVIDELNVSGLNRSLTFKIRSNKTATFKAFINYNRYSILYDLLFSVTSASATTTLDISSIDLSSMMPEMTVYDFVSGIFKNFNLTCYPKTTTIFQVEPLDDWYNKGIIRDITQYTTTEEITVSRVPLYKSIKFEHEQSQSFLNRQFFDNNNREYGDLNTVFNYDGGEYNIKVPFENLLHTEFDGTMTQVGYCLTKAPDFKPYIPKPILLYMYNQQSTSIKFYDGISTNTLTTYMPFGQDMKQNSTNYSLNWGADNSSLLKVPITMGKYATYYYGYLSNLFNKKNRLVNVKTFLPLSILTQLKLNDRLIIRDKRYIINQMNSKLTTGEVDLELINDFRTIKKGFNITTGKGIGTVQLPILFPNLAKSASISTTAAGVTFSSSSLTSEDTIDVTLPADTNVYYNRITEDGNNRITETFSDRITEQGYNNVITIDVLYTFEDGTTDTYENYIIQKQ